MENNIIGRRPEIERLKKYVESNRSEFIVIYGRRRVGKTFLVRELFDQRLAFRMTGKENTSTKERTKSTKSSTPLPGSISALCATGVS